MDYRHRSVSFILFGSVLISCSNSQHGTRIFCIDEFARYNNKTTGWDFVNVRCDTYGYFARSYRVNLQSTSSCPRPVDRHRYCMGDTRDRNCDGMSLCQIDARFVRRWSYQSCYNGIIVEYECIIDWHTKSISICLPVQSVTPTSGHPMYISISMEPTTTSDGCKKTINLPSSHRMRIVVVKDDPYPVLKFCTLTNIAYLYILDPYEDIDMYLDAIPDCSWDDFTSGVETYTTLEIHFPELTYYNLILEITAVAETTTTTTTTKTPFASSTTTKANTASKSSTRSDSSNNSAVIIAITVVLCIAIVGIGVGAGVYIYRHPMTKVSQMFRPSRGLRRRPGIERNIYSATNSEVRASDVRPQPSAPSIRHITSPVDRSITGMRLPAIPPSEVDTTVPQTTTRSFRADSAGSPPPRPLPINPTSSPEMAPQEVSEDDKIHSRTSDVALPIPIALEDSDSDNSDDDKEYIPKHRFTMVRVNSAQHRNNEKKEEELEQTSKGDNNEADNQPQQYVNVDELKEELNVGITYQNKINENKIFTENNHKDESVTSNAKGDHDISTEYANVVKEKKHASKTDNLEGSTIVLPQDDSEEPREI